MTQIKTIVVIVYSPLSIGTNFAKQKRKGLAYPPFFSIFPYEDLCPNLVSQPYCTPAPKFEAFALRLEPWG